MVRADHDAVDHLDTVWRCTAIVEGIEHQLPQPELGPAPELAIATRLLAKLIRQVAPSSTSARNSENAIKNNPVVSDRSTNLTPNCDQKRLKKRPLGILHQQRVKIATAKAILNHIFRRLLIQFANRT